MQGMPAFKIYDILGFKNVASCSSPVTSHVTYTEIVNYSSTIRI